MGVSYNVGVRVVTHSQIALAAHQQLARLDAVDRAGCAGQRHSFVDLSVVAHDRNAADLKAKPASFLWCTKQPRILASIALRVLLHASLGPAKDADLKSILLWDQTAVVPTTAHDRRGCSGWNRVRKRRRAGAVVVPRLTVGDVVAVNSRVGVATVRVQIASDLGTSRGS